jgi:glycosyltransferase involved in cell wall biosynthesis
VHIALIADAFPPMRSSGAVQLRDLAREFVSQGHALTVMLPAPGLDAPWRMDVVDGARVLRLRAPQTKDVGYVRRAIGEFTLPYAMLWNLRRSPFWRERWDGIAWYSPTIFFGPLVALLKKMSVCKGYLIVRDIFPDWALDMGILSRGLPYFLFTVVAKYQYSIADVIGVQTPGNLRYFRAWSSKPARRVEVLQNWLGETTQGHCSIRISQTPLADRKIFVYAGNMGVAQGVDVFLQLAERMRRRSDVGFLFVGRGTEVERLADAAKARKLDNVLFHDEIDPEEIPELYAQCHVGLIALDPRHKTHNIPGKFLTYMQGGLPVLAAINRDNDLIQVIEVERVGCATSVRSAEVLELRAEELLRSLNADPFVATRCIALFERAFSPQIAVRQIVAGLQHPNFVSREIPNAGNGAYCPPPKALLHGLPGRQRIANSGGRHRFLRWMRDAADR